jgi:hypothetical protein
MSTSDDRPDDRQAKIADLASDIAANFAEVIEDDKLADVSDASLAQLFAIVVKLYGAKAQVGNPPRPFARNSGITPQDVAIGATGMLEGVNVPLFDLALWQSWSSVGKREPDENDAPGGADQQH